MIYCKIRMQYCNLSFSSRRKSKLQAPLFSSDFLDKFFRICEAVVFYGVPKIRSASLPCNWLSVNKSSTNPGKLSVMKVAKISSDFLKLFEWLSPRLSVNSHCLLHKNALLLINIFTVSGLREVCLCQSFLNFLFV